MNKSWNYPKYVYFLLWSIIIPVGRAAVVSPTATYTVAPNFMLFVECMGPYLCFGIMNLSGLTALHRIYSTGVQSQIVHNNILKRE